MNNDALKNGGNEILADPNFTNPQNSSILTSIRTGLYRCCCCLFPFPFSWSIYSANIRGAPFLNEMNSSLTTII